ncbi:hypothetical protein GCM10023264_22730 [Sphingomonas daechungensis]|uniref:Cistern family PEP-CTERM protein n=1 Tax=Sphingomonas daechungensis TaxID=1176646 RepID=A0ABX6T369_9SPHN|nr:cistern family PEP-CTERM protein [Sphingomonas daechungensis]QNP43663.1 cistern family PEP-CTERM protein [Sphingomonas daechungensis]
MKLVLRAAVAVLAMSAAMPASAAIIFDYNTGILTVDGNTTVGDSTTISFNGFSPNSPVIPGLTGDLTLVFQGLSGNNYTFTYRIANTSGSPIDAARVTAFGFDDITPNATLLGSSVTGTYGTVSSGSLPGNIDLEFCAKNGQNNNCSGSSGGPGVGQTGSGNLTIAFSGSNPSITLSGMYVRWQGIDSTQLGITGGSAIGTPTPPSVPEPASWAMMLMGFTAVGFAVRRRRKTLIPQAA